MTKQANEIVLLKDSQWKELEGDLCRVTEFIPWEWTFVMNGNVQHPNKEAPYASVVFQCTKLPGPITGFITHRVDFAHLWAAFRDRGVKSNEEVIIAWSRKHLSGLEKVFSAFFPKLTVMVCPSGAFKLMTDSNWKPQLKGEARWNAQEPIVRWNPK